MLCLIPVVNSRQRERNRVREENYQRAWAEGATKEQRAAKLPVDLRAWNEKMYPRGIGVEVCCIVVSNQKRCIFVILSPV